MRHRDPMFAGLFLVASCHDPANDAVARIQVTPEQGGQLVSPNKHFTLDVPPGAVQSATEIAVREIANDEAVAGVAYDLSPDGLTFDVPASATFASALVTTGTATEVALGIPRSSSGGEPELLADAQTTLDLVAGTVTTTATVAHFSEAVETEVGVVNVTEGGGAIEFQIGINTESSDTVQVRFGGCDVSNLGLRGVSAVSESSSLDVGVSCDSVAGQVQRMAEMAPGGLADLTLRCAVDVLDQSAQSNQVSIDTHVPCTPEQLLTAPCFEPFGARIDPPVTGGCPSPAPVSIEGSYRVDRGIEAGAFQVGVTLQSDSAERPFASQLELRSGDGSLFVGVFEGADLQPSFSAFVVDPLGTIVATLEPTGSRSDAGAYSVSLMLQGSPGDAVLNAISTAKIHYTGQACFGENEIALAPLAACPWKD